MDIAKKDIRWKQRFQNFGKTFLLLQKTVEIENPSEAERGGLIQFYKRAFELAWKVMKDYLEELGFSVNSPREAIKQAFQSGVIENGQGWIDALEDRNLTTPPMMKVRRKRLFQPFVPPIIQCYANYMSCWGKRLNNEPWSKRK
jgi:nucleotidyltransferase substrate binding protein (TIGR01987 family)